MLLPGRFVDAPFTMRPGHIHESIQNMLQIMIPKTRVGSRRRLYHGTKLPVVQRWTLLGFQLMLNNLTTVRVPVAAAAAVADVCLSPALAPAVSEFVLHVAFEALLAAAPVAASAGVGLAAVAHVVVVAAFLAIVAAVLGLAVGGAAAEVVAVALLAAVCFSLLVLAAAVAVVAVVVIAHLGIFYAAFLVLRGILTFLTLHLRLS